jgi:uncharacterized phage-associated protein
VTYSAHDVAAELRVRLPGLGTKKLHKLLYYCQGHHLAAFGEPLFREEIAAWDMGPVVDALWAAEKHGDGPAPPSGTGLDEAALNTVGYVLSRYGALTGHDLEVMTHGEPPWRLADAARRPGQSAPIRPRWIRDFFTADGSADDGSDDGTDDPWPDPAGLVAADAADVVDVVDDPADLRAWAARGA